MDDTRICPRCRQLGENIASYLDGKRTPLTAHALGTVDQLVTDCTLCEFWLEAYKQIPSPNNAALRAKASLEINTSNQGTLYLSDTAHPGEPHVHILPLGGSRPSVTGRIVPSQCDFPLIRKWLRSCQDWHGPACYTPGWSDVISPLSGITMRLIDVDEGCLVHARTDCRYVALSYVWGKAKVFHTTRSNVAALHQVGGLNQVFKDIPMTIADAISLLRLIGERYLWVDSLCIVQDDLQEKQSQIASMDAVYGNAFLTINAATGRDANAGLPGVRPASREVGQLIVEYRPGRTLIAAQPVLSDIVDESYWNTRAWTYQERFLSKRSLTFTDRYVFYQCQRLTWCEDVVAEDEKIIDYHQMQDYLPVNWSAEYNEHMYKLHYALHVQHSPNWVEYLRTVEEYTPRALSFDSDVLAAFSGMSKVLSTMFRSALLYGLPEVLFDCALLWQPAGTLVRRQTPGSTAGFEKFYFPSWSWAGWKGPIVYEDIMPHLKMLSSELVRRTKPLVKWQKETADRSRSIPILRAGDVGKYLLEPFENQLPEGWHESSGGMFDIFMGSYYYHDDFPASFFAIPSPFPTSSSKVDDASWTLITGRTLSAMLYISPSADRNSNIGDTRRFNITDHSGIWHGCVWLDISWSRKTQEKHEFIVLSEGCTPKAEIERFWSTEEWTAIASDNGESWYQYFNVLLVQREGDRATRVGIGKVDKARWNAIPGNEVDICLC